MTTLFKVQVTHTDNSVEDTMYPTKKTAETAMTEARKDGLDSVLLEVDLKKTGIEGISTKELMCALFNRENYAESGIKIKSLAGLKNPK